VTTKICSSMEGHGPEMKEAELRKHAQCSVCKNKIGQSGILFWKITVERFGVNLRSIQRQDGLAAFLGGNSELANIMGADKDLAEPVMQPITVTLCDSCAMSDICIAEIVE